MELFKDPIGRKFYLAEKIGDVAKFLDQGFPHGAVGFDTEADGLDTRKAKIVGLSLAVRPHQAIYVPLGHMIGHNLEGQEVISLIQERLTAANAHPVFYNGKYDASMVESNLGWVPPYYEDVMVSVMLDDPDRMEKGLKPVALDVLGYKMAAFESLFTDAERKAKKFNIATKSPRVCVEYAAADADATLRLHMHYHGIRDQFPLPFKIDTQLVDIIRRMEQDGGLELNVPYIDKQLKSLASRERILEEMIYAEAGAEFAIGSPKQLGDILFGKLGLPPTPLTKSGQYQTGAAELEKLSATYPIAEWVVSFKKIQKAKGSYFGKLLRLSERGIPVRFSFNQYSAPTYRLAAPGGDPDVDGKTGVNIQAVSNGEARSMMGVSMTTPTVDVNKTDYLAALEDSDLLFTEVDPTTPKDVTRTVASLERRDWHWEDEAGDQICIRSSCKGCDVGCPSAGIDVTRSLQKNILVVPSVRESFRAPEGYTLLGCDYDRQELVIGANLSKEQSWLRALLHNEDLHAQAAMGAFSMTQEQWDALPKDEKKRRRDLGKILNFATFYGATAHTLSRNTGLPLQVAENIYNGFVRNHPQLFRWMEQVKVFARKNGFTSTYFGRRRWLKRFYDEGSHGMRGFADRSAVNTAVQGSGADVIRIAMFKCDKWFRESQVPKEDARLVMSIHDELQFMVRDTVLVDVAPHLIRCMEFKVKNWEVQLSVGPKVGRVWGQQKAAPYLRKDVQ